MRRQRVLFGMLSTLALLLPMRAMADERIDRIESLLQEMQQKIEALSEENRQLRSQIKQPAGSPGEATDTTTGAATAAAGATTIEQTPVAEPQATAQASDPADTQERLDLLEAGQEELSYHADHDMKVGGYASAEYYLTNQPNENSQFRIRHLSLFFSKKIQNDWELFTEMEFEDAPFIESAHVNNTAATVQGKFLVEQMYVKYHPTLKWDILAGRFLTPGGLWNVFHYYPYVLTQTRPMMVRTLYPQWSDGLQLHYGFTPSIGNLDMHLYVANGAGNPGKLDRNVSKAVGSRFDFVPGILSDELHVGASFYRERDNANVTRTTLGSHMLLRLDDWTLQSEFARRLNTPANAIAFHDASLYAQLAFDYDKWTFGGRYDWYNTDSTIPLSNQFRYTAAINYHFAHNVVGKIEYNRNTFANPALQDFNQVIAAISIAIGDY